jgi:hypothetical protein
MHSLVHVAARREHARHCRHDRDRVPPDVRVFEDFAEVVELALVGQPVDRVSNDDVLRARDRRPERAEYLERKADLERRLKHKLGSPERMRRARMASASAPLPRDGIDHRDDERQTRSLMPFGTASGASGRSSERGCTISSAQTSSSMPSLLRPPAASTLIVQLPSLSTAAPSRGTGVARTSSRKVFAVVWRLARELF